MNEKKSRIRGVLKLRIWVTAGSMICLMPPILYASAGQEHVEIESPFTLAMRVLNFLILVGILYFLLNKPVRNFFNKRQQGVRETLESAQKARDEAEIRYREMENKLKRARKEMEDLKQMLVEQGRVEKEKIFANAKKEADKIRRGAEIDAEQEFKKAQLLLRREAVDMAASLAEALLKERIEAEDHQRLIHDYLESLGKTS